MTWYRHECPKCPNHYGFSTEVPNGEFEHHCPHNRNRRTPFVEVIKEPRA